LNIKIDLESLNIDPVSNGFVSVSNCPEWCDLTCKSKEKNVNLDVQK
jgi:hypothetical protein